LLSKIVSKSAEREGEEKIGGAKEVKREVGANAVIGRCSEKREKMKGQKRFNDVCFFLVIKTLGDFAEKLLTKKGGKGQGH